MFLTSGPLPLPDGSLRHERRPRPEAALQPLRAALGESERRQEAQQLSDGVRLTTRRAPRGAGRRNAYKKGGGGHSHRRKRGG